MGVESIARMLSLMLYGRRFFPYYTFNIVAGVDDEGACSSLSQAPPPMYSPRTPHMPPPHMLGRRA